jgi:sugar lactone lactonase YvrE
MRTPTASSRGPWRHLAWFTLAVVSALAFAYVVWWWRAYSRVESFALADPSVTVVAGDGLADVRDGPSHTARFSEPFGVAAAPDGSVYVADAGRAHRIRRISPDGMVSTVAGGEPGYQDGPASTARFDTPSGLSIDSGGGVLVADTGNDVIRRISPDGTVTTVAGDGAPGDRDGPAQQAQFRGPTGVAVDARGRIIVADTYNDRIRVIDSGLVSTIAGTGRPGWADGPARESALDTPVSVAVDPAFNIYVADSGNIAIRRISPDGRTSTVPDQGLVRPTSVVVDRDGVVYAAGDHRVVAIRADGDARVVAGSTAGFGDGPGTVARFRGLTGLALAGNGDLIAADSVNALVRRISFRSRPDPPLPASPLINPGFDAAVFGLFPLLWPFAPQAGPFEITATFGEPRSGDQDRRLHAGLDIASPEGTDVLAIRDGTVSSLVGVTAFDTIYEAVRVGPVAYVHLRVGRDRHGRVLDTARFVPSWDENGRLVRMRVRRGARFRTGDRLGTLNAFNHAHLNVGWMGEEENPLRFRVPHMRDTTPPVIAPDGVRLFSEDAQPLTRTERGRLIVTGRVEIVVDAWDQVDGNAARRRLGVYSLGFQVLRPDESPAPTFDTPAQTMVFDRGPNDEAAALVFASGSGIPGRDSRASRFLYRATTTFRNGVAKRGYWDTRALPAGDYILRLWIADIRGNVARRNRDVPITIRH